MSKGDASVDILYNNAFQAMMIQEKHLVPERTPIQGITQNEIKIKGTINLIKTL